MPAILKKSASIDEKQLIKFPTGLSAIKSVVIDATDFLFTEGVRNLIPKGTILKYSQTNPDKMTEYRGTGKIEGILKENVDLGARSTAASEPAPMLFHEVVFNTAAVVQFTNYASALISSMPTCKFE
jgi:hypothetical protein